MEAGKPGQLVSLPPPLVMRVLSRHLDGIEMHIHCSPSPIVPGFQRIPKNDAQSAMAWLRLKGLPEAALDIHFLAMQGRLTAASAREVLCQYLSAGTKKFDFQHALVWETTETELAAVSKGDWTKYLKMHSVVSTRPRPRNPTSIKESQPTSVLYPARPLQFDFFFQAQEI